MKAIKILLKTTIVFVLLAIASLSVFAAENPSDCSAGEWINVGIDISDVGQTSVYFSGWIPVREHSDAPVLKAYCDIDCDDKAELIGSFSATLHSDNQYYTFSSALSFPEGTPDGLSEIYLYAEFGDEVLFMGSKQVVFIKELPAYSKNVTTFINSLKWCDNAAWDVDHTPTISTWNSTGCAAYAGDFVKWMYDCDNPRDGTVFYSPESIQTGDIVWIVHGHHWIAVMYRHKDGSLLTCEGNYLGFVQVTDSVYSVHNNQFLHNGSPFRTFNCGYRFL